MSNFKSLGRGRGSLQKSPRKSEGCKRVLLSVVVPGGCLCPESELLLPYQRATRFEAFVDGSGLVLLGEILVIEHCSDVGLERGDVQAKACQVV